MPRKKSELLTAPPRPPHPAVAALRALFDAHPDDAFTMEEILDRLRDAGVLGPPDGPRHAHEVAEVATHLVALVLNGTLTERSAGSARYYATPDAPTG